MLTGTTKGVFTFTLLPVKKWLAYILLCIFSFQVLPVKELGKLLFKGQLTEEIHEESYSDAEDLENNKLKKNEEPLKFHMPLDELFARSRYYTHNIMVAIHEADHIPLLYLPDIPTPPPNC
ncbi:MAG: hypothetical protein EOP56_07910 [Sphingobacteriales bacterium]|nr:MAG: hypothetical protein EOP56_07910 [Sphingobacteriales bacterium]